MTLPLLLAAALSEETTVQVGLIGSIVLGAIAWGATRQQVADLRERVKGDEATLTALVSRVASLEERAGRSDERFDRIFAALASIDERLRDIQVAVHQQHQETRRSA